MIILAYVLSMDVKGLREEMLFTRNLITNTNSKTISKENVTYFKETNIPLKTYLPVLRIGIIYDRQSWV